MKRQHSKDEKQNVPRPDAELSSTMRIPVEEILDPDAEMRLDVRCSDTHLPTSIVLQKRSYDIGRRQDADIPLMPPSVSRRHARLFYNHTEEIIEDMNSANGTFVNGVRVTRCVLQNNDIIRIGDATLLFTRTSNRTTE